MRVRVRGPSGQSVITVDEAATVQDLRDQIAKETSLSSFDVKLGYPPKPLFLEQFPSSQGLSDAGIKINGEQLIVSRKDSSTQREGLTSSPSNTATSTKGAAPKLRTSVPHTQSTPDNEQPLRDAATGFSFDGFGKAPPPKPQPKSTGNKQPSNKSSSAPLSLSRKQNASIAEDTPEVILPELGGTLVLRVMPDDNSCMFRAVANAVTPAMDTMNELRSIIAQLIQSQPDKYPRVVLDNKEPDEYCRWIQTEDAWGGQIELDILSRHFDIEICSIDVQTLRVDRYNEGMATRCILVYSGIHYDIIALSPFDSPPEDDGKIFDAADDTVLNQAVALCQMLQDRHYFTDTAGFRIQCNVCKAMVVGERGATEHASQTGHYDFGEAA